MEKSANMAAKGRTKHLGSVIWRQRWLFLMSVPFLVWLIIFKYIPMIRINRSLTKP